MAKEILVSREELKQIEIFEGEGGRIADDVVYVIIEREQPQLPSDAKLTIAA